MLQIGLFFCFLALAAGQTFSIEHYGKVARVSEPRIAPDGQSVAMVVSRPNYADNVWESDLIRVDLRSKRVRPLTQRKTARHPRWSASGGQLAFLASVTGKPQIFILENDGGEAIQITHAPAGVQGFAWKPDGSAFVYVTAEEAPKRDKYDDSFTVEANDYLMQTSSQPEHLWTVSSTGGDPKRLTSGKWSASSTGDPAWSPTGDRIAFVSQPSPGTRDWDKRTMQVVRADGSGMEAMAGARDRACFQPVFSPDSKWLAMTCPVDGHVKNQNELLIMPAAGGEWKRLTAPLDRNFSRATWTADSAALIAGANDGAYSGLWTLPIAGAPQRWNLGKVCVTNQGDVDVTRDGRLVFIGTEPQRPAELYLATRPSAEPARITDLQAEIAAMKLGRPEFLRWKSSDGLPLSGVLTFPPDFDESKKYPLVLLIHGGPWGSSRETFSERSQLFAGRGWMVFEPNYRGSDNQGNALFSAVYRDHGDGPGRDVMAGLQELKKRPYVDAGRIGVSGWSYGGYMTTWLIGHYAGWKAAMAGAAVIDLVDDYNLNDFRLFTRAYSDTLTQPADLELMKAQSPLTYVDRMKTPLLLLSDTGDVRVPVTQSYKLFHALRERGQDVQMVLYPVPGHFPADPYRARDIDKRWMEWFVERLK